MKTNNNTNYDETKHKMEYLEDNLNFSSNNTSKTKRLLKKLIVLANVESNLIKIFGINQLCIPILIFIKNLLIKKFPSLNKYIFKQQTSSLTITYTHFTSTYYNQQNNSTECNIYKSILSYVLDKKPSGCKFTSNPGGNILFFDQFDEIQINKKIWLVSKNSTTNTSILYILELISYVSNIDEINKFIKYCLKKYQPKIRSDSLISSNLKYYKYIGTGTGTNHQCMFDEYPFIQTKTFSNIFFEKKTDLVNKIKYFVSNEETYRLIGRPYSMGIILYGKPGTGKTSCTKAIAELTQRHIIDISLKKIKTQKELNEIFYGGKINGEFVDMRKKLFVLEEFDCIIHRLRDRKLYTNNTNNTNDTNNTNNIDILNSQIEPTNDKHNHNEEGIYLEDLLNLLDGTCELSGSMFVATTNHIDILDQALLRPGRFDLSIEFKNANDKIIIQMIKHFSKKNIKKLKKKITSSTNEITNEITDENSKNLTKEHINIISQYSIWENKLVWSPAKISQICLSHIDSSDYYWDVICELKNQYEDEIKLLQNFN